MASVPPAARRYSAEVNVLTFGAATFYIDGSRVNVTHTVPSALMGLMPAHIFRTAHNNDQDRTVEIDYFKYEFRPETRGAMYPQ